MMKNTRAFFINPKGKILELPENETHIGYIYKNLKEFEPLINNDLIDQTYRKFKEVAPREGKARDEIITKLMQNGWIRIRIYGDNLEIQIKQFDDSKMNYIKEFVKKYKLEEYWTILTDENRASTRNFDNASELFGLTSYDFKANQYGGISSMDNKPYDFSVYEGKNIIHRKYK